MKKLIRRNFDEPPLTFEEFIARGDEFSPNYNNFFHNFYKLGEGQNYKMLKQVDNDLAERLSDVYEKFVLSKRYVDQSIREKNLKGYTVVEGHAYPKEILEIGYKAYLILRESFKNSPELLDRIKKYKEGATISVADDAPAFFS